MPCASVVPFQIVAPPQSWIATSAPATGSAFEEVRHPSETGLRPLEVDRHVGDGPRPARGATASSSRAALAEPLARDLDDVEPRLRQRDADHLELGAGRLGQRDRRTSSVFGAPVKIERSRLAALTLRSHASMSPRARRGQVQDVAADARRQRPPATSPHRCATRFVPTFVPGLRIAINSAGSAFSSTMPKRDANFASGGSALTATCGNAAGSPRPACVRRRPSGRRGPRDKGTSSTRGTAPGT